MVGHFHFFPPRRIRLILYLLLIQVPCRVRLAVYPYFFLLLFYQDPIVCVMELLFPRAELTKKQKDQDVLSAHAAGTKGV